MKKNAITGFANPPRGFQNNLVATNAVNHAQYHTTLRSQRRQFTSSQPKHKKTTIKAISNPSERDKVTAKSKLDNEQLTETIESYLEKRFIYKFIPTVLKSAQIREHVWSKFLELPTWRQASILFTEHDHWYMIFIDRTSATAGLEFYDSLGKPPKSAIWNYVVELNNKNAFHSTKLPINLWDKKLQNNNAHRKGH